MERVRLDDEDWVEVGAVPEPAALCPDFEALWSLHPPSPDVLTLYGRPTPIPRYQRAYGRDYAFSHQVSRAEPVPVLLAPCLAWVRSVDERLNGLLVNWYDGAQGHRIGPHRDSAQGLIPGSPIPDAVVRRRPGVPDAPVEGHRPGRRGGRPRLGGHDPVADEPALDARGRAPGPRSRASDLGDRAGLS